MLLLASADAGSATADAVDAARSVLADAGPVTLVGISSPESLEAALDARAGRLPVIAGGDGSLHLLVRRLAARGELGSTAVGLVPLGTGNDFARAIGLPLDPAAAAAAILSGVETAYDVLRDDAGGVVVNAVHLGVGALAARSAAGLKPRLGPVAYPLGALPAGMRSGGWPLRVVVDGRVLAEGSRPALMVGVGNGRGIGGGTPLHPAADPGDGLLDVLVSWATGPLARIGYGLALARGRQRRRVDTASGRGRSVTVSVPPGGRPVPVNADGELGESLRERTWRVEPGALRLRH